MRNPSWGFSFGSDTNRAVQTQKITRALKFQINKKKKKKRNRDGTFCVANTQSLISWAVEPRSEKTGLRGFRPGPTQTRLYKHRI